MKCGYHGFVLFLFPMLCFLHCLPLFSVSIFGAWHYMYHHLMMLKIGFGMLLELDTQVWKKSGSGPRNGEQYRAPFVEEEWDEDEDVVVFVPGELVAEEVVAGHESTDEAVNLEKCIDMGLSHENDPLPLNLFYGDCSKHAGGSKEFNENEQKPFIDMEINHCGSKQPTTNGF